MKLSCTALLALAAAGALHAHAQTATPFETSATGAASACLAAPQTPEGAPAAITACEKLIVDLNALKTANTSLGPHDTNVYHIVMGMAETRVAASMGRIDGVRSARVCQRTENAWTHIAQTVAASSPGYTGMIDNLRASTQKTIGICRSEFGTPAGATPL
jgi:hypothetical protein